MKRASIQFIGLCMAVLCPVAAVFGEQPVSVSSATEPMWLTAVGSYVYFTAITPNEGRELWVTDGTRADTHLVADLWAGTGSSNPRQLTAQGNHLWFSADRGLPYPCDQIEVFRTDGTTVGTVSVSNCAFDSWPFHDHRPIHFASAEGRMVWSAHNGLFSSLGEAGDIAYQGEFLHMSELIQHSDDVLFYGEADDQGIWRTDGTTTGTELVTPLDSAGFIHSFLLVPSVFVETELYFVQEANPYVLRVLISSGETWLLQDVLHKPAGRSDIGAMYLTALPEVFVFSFDDGIHGRELWRGAPSEADTAILRDLAPGPAGSNPEFLTLAGAFVYFAATEDSNGRELWKTYATPDGTVMVADVVPGPTGSNPSYLTPAPFEDGVVFFATGPGGQVSLWHTSNRDSTRALTDENSRPLISPRELTVIGLRAFFVDGGLQERNLLTIDLASTYYVSRMAGCLAGPTVTSSDSQCAPAFDDDADTDIDLKDAAAFLNRL